MVIKKYVPKQIKNSMIAKRFAVRFLHEPIKVWYWRSEIINFGDELTPDIIQSLFKKKVIRLEVDEADLFAVGSIIEVTNRPRNKKAYVWGSGFIEEGSNISNSNLIFLAARGYLTRERLPRKYKNIPVGDPGLLSNLIYKKSSHKTDKIGIIPHYVDEDNRVLEKAKKLPDIYKIISVRSTPKDVARQITECRVVLSSSLHGLIVADSFGVPNMHLPLSNKVYGGDYKFKDYYSSINRKYFFFSKKNLYKKSEIDKVVNEYRPVEQLEEIQDKLIESFPYK